MRRLVILASLISPTAAASGGPTVTEYWLEQGEHWIVLRGPELIAKALLFLLIVVVFALLSSIVGRLLRRALSASRLQFSRLIIDFFVSLASKATLFIGLLIALSQAGIQLGPLIAGLGVAGFIAGFAMQDSLSNFMAGLMILIYRPFDVGDAVEAGGIKGNVSRMSLSTTTIHSFDNQRIIVPNSKIWGNVIINITAEYTRRVDMEFSISYHDDVDLASQILTEVVASHELVLETPEPVIRMHRLGDSSIDFVVRPWAKTADYWTVYWDLLRNVKRRFDAEGITIPFPQRDIHLRHDTAGLDSTIQQQRPTEQT